MGERGEWGCADKKRDGGEDSIELDSGEFCSGKGFIEGRTEVGTVYLSSASRKGVDAPARCQQRPEEGMNPVDPAK